jgi:hypothetical protein
MAYVKRVKLDVRVVAVYPDGDCLFTCFAQYLNRNNVKYTTCATNNEGSTFTAKLLRTVAANELIRLEGQVPGTL